MNKFLESYLSNILPVSFVIRCEEEESIIGEGTPEFTVDLHKIPEKKDMLASTSLALGEAYIKGELEVDQDLYMVLDSFLRHIDKFSRDEVGLKRILYTSVNKKNQEKEVVSHYDLGNDFYKLWLDDTLSYSCGYFVNGSNTLYEAQVNKVDHILEKLYLKEDMEFTRMWELYLTSCAAAFNNGIVDLHQILMSKGVNNDIPMVRK